jgi:hypothetical protein
VITFMIIQGWWRASRLNRVERPGALTGAGGARTAAERTPLAEAAARRQCAHPVAGEVVLREAAILFSLALG